MEGNSSIRNKERGRKGHHSSAKAVVGMILWQPPPTLKPTNSERGNHHSSYLHRINAIVNQWQAAGEDSGV